MAAKNSKSSSKSKTTTSKPKSSLGSVMKSVAKVVAPKTTAAVTSAIKKVTTPKSTTPTPKPTTPTLGSVAKTISGIVAPKTTAVVTSLMNKKSTKPTTSTLPKSTTPTTATKKYETKPISEVEGFMPVKKTTDPTAEPATEPEQMNLPKPITDQITEEENFQKKWDAEAEALKKTKINAESDYTDAVVEAAENKYQAEQDRLEELKKVQEQALEHKNEAATSAAEVERRDAELAYKTSKEDLEIQRERAEKQYQTSLVEQKTANTKRVLELESSLAAMGGFGSLAKNKELLDMTISNDRLVNSIVFEKETTNKEYTNSLTNLSQDYQNDLYKIESNKATAIQENYDTYLEYVTDIQADAEMSEVEKYNAITQAKAEYKKNVAQINQDAFTTRYELAKNAKDKIYELKFRQIDPNVSSIVGFAADSNGNAILDEEGNKIEVPTSGKFKLQTDLFGNPIGYFDETTGTFVNYSSVGGASGAVDVSTINSWLNAPSSQGFGAKIGYNDGGAPGVHDGIDFTLPGGANADVKAPIAGTVTKIEVDAGTGKGYGNSVTWVDGNGNEHKVSHLSSINVAQGQAITASTVLGKQGNTGFTKGVTGIHVDYRIKNSNGQYINPEGFLQNLTSGGGVSTSSGMYDPGFQQFLLESGLNPTEMSKFEIMNAKALYESGGSVSKTLDQNTKLKISKSNEGKATKAFYELQVALSKYKSLINEVGAVGIFEEKQPQLTNAYADLKVKWKEAANLGALTGPDLGLIEDAIPDVTSAWGVFRKLLPGDAKEQIMDTIDQESATISNYANRNVELLSNTYENFIESDLYNQMVKEANTTTFGNNSGSSVIKVSSSEVRAEAKKQGVSYEEYKTLLEQNNYIVTE